MGEVFWGRKISVPIQDNDAAVLYYSGAIIGLEYRLFRFFKYLEKYLKTHSNPIVIKIGNKKN